MLETRNSQQHHFMGLSRITPARCITYSVYIMLSYYSCISYLIQGNHVKDINVLDRLALIKDNTRT
ncbi:MAG: hypothetical protein ACMUIA_10450 [bacterium]